MSRRSLVERDRDRNVGLRVCNWVEDQFWVRVTGRMNYVQAQLSECDQEKVITMEESLSEQISAVLGQIQLQAQEALQ